MRSPGEELLTLCAKAGEDVVLVAPFIKTGALERILEAIPNEITSIRCVTRWRPEEIAAGVSDVRVFDVIQRRQGARLFIHPWLHAKFFRVDGECLIGSANVTQRALGWAIPANLELMFEVPADAQRLREFEKQLFAASFEATELLRNEMSTAADLIRASGSPPKLLSEESLGDDDTATLPADVWLPLCTRPERLFQIYAGHDTERIIGWTLEAGQRDIRTLRIPPGLGKTGFHRFVAASFQQAPQVQRIHNVTVDVITPETGRNLISSSVDEQYQIYSPEEHWNTMRAWLLHFLPHIYRQPAGSNDLQRGIEIGEFRG